MLTYIKYKKIQNFASKVASGHGKKYDPATPYINQLEWLKIDNKLIYDVCLFVYKILHKHIPDRILMLEPMDQIRPRQTRQNSHLMVPSRRTVIADRAISVRGPKLWNGLPEDVRECGSLPLFKKKLKSLLFMKQ